MAAAKDDGAAGGEQTVTRSRFVISERALKPPTVAAPKRKAHKRQGIGAVMHTSHDQLPSHWGVRLFKTVLQRCSVYARSCRFHRVRRNGQDAAPVRTHVSLDRRRVT